MQTKIEIGTTFWVGMTETQRDLLIELLPVVGDLSGDIAVRVNEYRKNKYRIIQRDEISEIFNALYQAVEQ